MMNVKESSFGKFATRGCAALLCIGVLAACTGNSDSGGSGAVGTNVVLSDKAAGNFAVVESVAVADPSKAISDVNSLRYCFDEKEFALDTRIAVGMEFGQSHEFASSHYGISQKFQSHSVVESVNFDTKQVSQRWTVSLGEKTLSARANCDYSNPKPSSRYEDSCKYELQVGASMPNDSFSFSDDACTVESGNVEKTEAKAEKGNYTFPSGKVVKATRYEIVKTGKVTCRKNREDANSEPVAMGKGKRVQIVILSDEVPTVGYVCPKKIETVYDFSSTSLEDGKVLSNSKSEIAHAKF